MGGLFGLREPTGGTIGNQFWLQDDKNKQRSKSRHQLMKVTS